MSVKDPGVRIRQAVSLLAGAVFLTLVVAPDAGRFYWTPLTIGLAYLGAAMLGGREGGHWATACALTGWGAAVVVMGAGRPDLDTSGVYLVGAGLGVTAGLLLQRAGYPISTLGMAVTVTVGGAVLALTTKVPGVLDNARVYALGLALIAATNVLLAARNMWRAAHPRASADPSDDAHRSVGPQSATDESSPPGRAAAPRRWTVLMLAGWVLAALAAGVPAGSGSSASAHTATPRLPIVVHSGPECFAGQGRPPAHH